MDHYPIPKASPNAIAAFSKVKDLEARSASVDAVQAAYDAYHDVIDAERREANRLNRAYEATLAREAAEARKVEYDRVKAVEARKLEFYRLNRQSEAAAAWREHTGNVNGFGT